MNTNVKLGFFVAVVVVVFTIFTLNLSRGFLRGDWKTYYIDFRGISTLEKGSPVKQAGLTVGEVTAMRPETSVKDGREEHTVRVKIHVSPSALISRDSVGEIVALGLMGEKYIEVTYGTGDPAPEDSILEGHEPFDIMAQGLEVADTVQKLLVTLDKYLGPEDTQLAFKEIIQNVSDISRATADLIGAEENTLRSTISNLEEASGKLIKTIDHANGLIANASGVITKTEPGITGLVASASDTMGIIRTQVVEDVRLVAADLQETSSKLSVLIDRVDEMVRKNEPSVNASLANVQELTTNGKRAAAQLEQSFQKLDRTINDIQQGKGVIGKLIADATMEQAAEKIILDARDTFDTLSGVSRVRDRLGFDYSLRGFEEHERFNDDQTHLRNDLRLRVALNENWSVLVGANDVGMDTGLEAQVARAIGPLTIRAGILESEMALGTDVHLGDWATLEFDGIALTEDGKERFDAHARVPVRFIQGVSVYGGVQDVGEENFANLGITISY